MDFPDKALKARFADADIEWVKVVDKEGEPNTLWGPYLTEPAIRQRLDEAVGPANWSMAITFVGTDKPVATCALTLLGITRTGVGEDRRADEPWKAAATDAFKRAARLFGVGSYLKTEIGQVWLKKGADGPTGHGPRDKGKGRPTPAPPASPPAPPPQTPTSAPDSHEKPPQGGGAGEAPVVPGRLSKPWDKLSQEELQGYIKGGYEGFRAFLADNGLTAVAVMELLDVPRPSEDVQQDWKAYIKGLMAQHKLVEPKAYGHATFLLREALRRKANADAASEAQQEMPL